MYFSNRSFLLLCSEERMYFSDVKEKKAGKRKTSKKRKLTVVLFSIHNAAAERGNGRDNKMIWEVGKAKKGSRVCIVYVVHSQR